MELSKETLHDCFCEFEYSTYLGLVSRAMHFKWRLHHLSWSLPPSKWCDIISKLIISFLYLFILFLLFPLPLFCTNFHIIFIFLCLYHSVIFIHSLLHLFFISSPLHHPHHIFVFFPLPYRGEPSHLTT